MKNENKSYIKVIVTGTKGLSPDVRSISFKFDDSTDAKKFEYTSGQFIMVSIPGFGESPLTITTPPSSLPNFDIAVKSVGNNTFALNRLAVGDSAYIRGPLGKEINFQNIYGRELVIIAGGIGIAPLMAIIREFKDNKELVKNLKLVYGAKTPDSLLFKEELADLEKTAETYLTVDKADKDWQGKTVRPTEIIKDLDIDKDAIVIICGPPVMYMQTTAILIKKGVAKKNINLIFERKMKCGIGKCQHCTCGKLYVCTDGPTFTAEEIDNNWEAFA